MKTSIVDLVQQSILKPCGLNLQGFDEFERTKDKAHMILVPAGSFVMGSMEDDARKIESSVPWYKASIAECPCWSPNLEEYLIDRFEVTNEQFAQFLNSNDIRPMHDDKFRGTLAGIDSKNQILCYDIDDFIQRRNIPNSRHNVGLRHNSNRWESVPGTERCPAVLVTWFGAMEYARWVEFDLPSEAQWEKAARGTDGREYPWGNIYDPSVTNTADRWLGRLIENQTIWDSMFYQNGQGEAWLASHPLPVGAIPGGESPYGCEDMVGNVAEWCATWYLENAYALYAEDKLDFSAKIAPTNFKCMRGAGRYGYADISRCACRRRREPATVSENLGFRCALAL